MKMKQVCAALFALGTLATTSLAHADVLPDFTVDPTQFGVAPVDGLHRTFVADKIVGNYSEVITFAATTFNFSLYFKAGNFVASDGLSSLDGGDTGLGSNYGLYALYRGSGTYTTSAAGNTFSLTPGGDLFVYVDYPRNNATNPGVPSTGSDLYTIGNSSDDTLVATGHGLYGTGSNSCQGSNNCGSFGQTTSFNLEPAGNTFFVLPRPFYELSIESGNFNDFAVQNGATQTINGAMNVIFATVPEPSSLALVGAALVGLSTMARRKKS